ncbi:bHLH domain-containing protein [Penicillium cosmopolitanum]|uniref:BHLH domain-containing protein n=1 Tax=Penicillium cosmopolitanum TaxID=1131564 RepID=A0A9W9W2R2_9EURO|nr:bHLH domain-containing protein [Penicillium cosmopolitanum]XP_057122565.1 bHLH domain-containing protein [Penicillium waksmanii]KAJ5397643.1 bHLH domain-containing protein [Penicillium cosmopolitanum]KAJ5983527.1 bHLH domain-containing protein [Penicillium waksmanii]
MSDPTMNSPDSVNKRKREGSEDLGHDAQRLNRSSHGSNGSMGPDNQHNFHSSLNYDHGLPNTGSEVLNIDQQILQHVGQAQSGMSDDNTLTAKAALAAHPHKYPPPPDSAFDANNLTQGLNFPDDMGQGPMSGGHNHNSTAAAVYAAREAQSMNSKPTVGSPEWHQIRKNNHKEVERRRREAINEGINQISRLVPNCDKNKGAILQRAIEYICQLQDEKKNIDERFEQHSLTTNHALSEISASNQKLKAEVSRRNNMAQKWLQRCRDAGLEFDDYEDVKELETFDLE